MINVDNGFTAEDQLKTVTDDQIKQMFNGPMALQVLCMLYIHELSPPTAASG